MAVQWGLGLNNGTQNAFQMGMAIGDSIRQRNIEDRTSNALSTLVSNPQQDDATFAQTVKGLPAQTQAQLINARQGYQQQQARATQAQNEQRRADLPFVGRLLSSVNDEATYQRARGVAQQYGIDLAGAPQNYDPAWVDQQKMTVQALSTPQGQEALSTAGKQAQDEGLSPGTPEFAQRVTAIWQLNNAKPYTDSSGATRLYVPGQSQPPTQQAIPRLTNPSEVSSLPPGSQFYDPNGVLRQVPGGPTQTASGGFR